MTWEARLTLSATCSQANAGVDPTSLGGTATRSVSEASKVICGFKTLRG